LRAPRAQAPGKTGSNVADERGRRKLGKAIPSELSAAAGVIGSWLDDLERSGNRLVGTRTRASLQGLFERCAANGGLVTAAEELAAGCSADHLDQAIRLLEKRALSALCADELDDGADETITAFLAALHEVSRKRSGKARAVTPTPSRSAGASPPAAEPATMWRAAADIQAARGTQGVVQALLDWAVRLSAAPGAVWWQQEENGERLIARRTSGLKLVGRARVLQPAEDFWRPDPDTPVAIPVITLSPERQDHAAFLTRVGAAAALIVRAHDGERWVGALSVHQADLPHGAVCFLAALTQQAAAALRARELEVRRRQLAEGHRSCVAELGHALASALDLKGLLTAVCRLALRLTGAEGCYLLLSEEQGPPVLRVREDARPSVCGLDAPLLSSIVELASAAFPDAPWWQPSSGHGEPATRLQQAGIGSLLGLPLPIRSEPLGALILVSERRNAFSALDREMVAAFAAQSAVAIENLQLFEDMQRRLLEMADLTWVSTHIAATLDAGRIAATVAEGAAKALSAPRTAMLLAQGRKQLVPVPAGCLAMPEEADALPPEASHLGTQVLDSGVPLAVVDAELEGYGEDPLVKWLQVRSLLCAPMMTQQGLHGILVVGDTQPRRFQTHTKALLAAYANQGALALQSALLHQDVVRHLHELTKLFELSQKLATSHELSGALEVVLGYACEILEAPLGLLMLCEPKTRELVVKAVRGFSAQASIESSIRLRPGEGMAGKAAQCGTVLTSADVRRDGRFRYRDVARQEGLRSGVCAPMMAGGRAVGVLNLYRPTTQEFTEEEQRLLAAVANSAALAVENAYLRQEAQERSQFLAALMGEINHRVRNSLQSVAGLLRMELRRPDQLSADQAIKRGIAHIQTVAVVHELMPTREFEFVDAKQVARRVLELTVQAVAPAGQHGRPAVTAQVSGARVMLPSQKATSLALILGELVDNALRHGLPEAGPAKLTVSLAEAGGEVVVQVKDNGPGLPADFDLGSSPGLGLSIAKGVAQSDLEGKLELESKAGLTARVRFPKSRGGPTGPPR